jgi:hypothetical protein
MLIPVSLMAGAIALTPGATRTRSGGGGLAGCTGRGACSSVCAPGTCSANAQVTVSAAPQPSADIKYRVVFMLVISLYPCCLRAGHDIIVSNKLIKFQYSIDIYNNRQELTELLKKYVWLFAVAAVFQKITNMKRTTNITVLLLFVYLFMKPKNLFAQEGFLAEKRCTMGCPRLRQRPKDGSDNRPCRCVFMRGG